jgi:hypothetical protein
VSSRTKTNAVSEQEVRTSCYYSPNKIIIIARTNLHLISKGKNINRGKILKIKNIKIEIEKIM